VERGGDGKIQTARIECKGRGKRTDRVDPPDRAERGGAARRNAADDDRDGSGRAG